MTWEFRVLTGLHAGARLKLTPGKHCLGMGPDADIRISDWDAAPLLIELDQYGVLTTMPSVPEEDQGNVLPSVWEAFETMRFGAVVLCAGPLGARWPDDIALLTSVLQPMPVPGSQTESAKKGRISKPHWFVLGTGAMVAAGMVLMLQVNRSTQAAELPVIQQKDLLAQVRDSVRDLRQPELQISRKGGIVIVSGLVENAADSSVVKQVLGRYDPSQVHASFSVASDVVQNLQESLADGNLAVSYRGNGIFEVSGTTKNAKQVQRIVEQVRADLGTNINRIDTPIVAAAPDYPSNVDTAMSAGNVRYTETSDGTKHFVPTNG